MRWAVLLDRDLEIFVNYEFSVVFKSRFMYKIVQTILLPLCMASGLFGQPMDKAEMLRSIHDRSAYYSEVAQQIFDLAEVGYQEVESSELLQKVLSDEGFVIVDSIADIPTAFVAEYGSGSPVIAVLGEYDALPGLSQDRAPERKSLGTKAGHACGHHLLGVGSAAAAVAAKEWLESNGREGTIRFYGCPAEEGGAGKVYLVRDGSFDDTDVVLHWHPSSSHSADAVTSLSNLTAKFRFHGQAAHAAMAPHRGRSALDGVEAMNMMANMMREHVPQDVRIHYVITDGGKAPNVVPDFAEVYYYVRHRNRAVVREVFGRLIKAAEGAALGTGTSTDYEVLSGAHELLPNVTLQRVMYENLQEVGGYELSEAELLFAEQICGTLGIESDDIRKDTEEIKVFREQVVTFASTDVGDVSFVTPTAGISAATWVSGTPAHSWQAVAAGGSSMAAKGMIVAAKTLALTAIDLFQNPALVESARSELEEKRGEDFQYESLIGDRSPPLDYRD